MTKKNALISGASGLVGMNLVKLLAEEQSYDNIYVLVRSNGLLYDLGLQDDPRFVELIVNYTQLDMPIGQIDDIFCALGTTIKKAGSKEKFYEIDHDYVINLAETGKAIGAHLFAIVTCMGANAESWNNYLKVKGEVERDLIQLDYKHLIVVRPSLLLGPRSEKRAGEKFGETLLKILRPVMLGSLRKQIPVHVSQVAKSMIHKAKILNADDKLVVVESNEIRVHEVKL